MEPKWKRFERLAFEIQKDLAGDAMVTFDDSVPGVDSGIDRQIDISIRQTVGPHNIFIAVECKDHQEPLDVNVVGEFCTVVKDVRANKGAIVSASGFTESALTLAKQHGIDAFRLVDTESVDWKPYVAVPVVLQRTGLRTYRLRLSNITTIPLSIWGSLPDARVVSNEGDSLGTVRDLVAHKWNESSIGEPGEVELELGQGVWLEAGDERAQVDITAVVQAFREHYFGHLPIQTRGLQDAQDGGLLTREIKTDAVTPARIEAGLEEGWKRIDDPAELAVKPGMLMAYRDVIPTSLEDDEG